jgi:hypothetical protein
MSLTARRRLWDFFTALYGQELTAESPRTATPDHIRTPLLAHQQAALYAARALETAKSDGVDVAPLPGDAMGGRFYTTHGILGDVVGSGKSLIALALVNAPPPSQSYTEYILRNGGALGDGRDVGLLRQRSHLTQSVSGIVMRPVRTALFIVPHALIGQWETYVARDTTLRAKFIKRKNEAAAVEFMTTIEDFDAIFVSSTMYNTWRATQNINTILWSRVFIDEADSIHISTGHDDINGLFYWFISASWLNLIFSNGAYLQMSTVYAPLPDTSPQIVSRVNNIMRTETQLTIGGVSHINVVRRMSGCGGYPCQVNSAGIQSARLIIHSNADFIKSSFTPPTITHTNIVCATPANIRVLDSFISNDMLERLHAGDLRGALEMLGMTAHSESEITVAVTASLEHELEQARRTHEYKKGIDYSSETAKAKAMEACEQKIASLENRIQAIKDRIRTSKEQTCPICYCDVSNPALTPCCAQLFCFPCLCESLKRVAACPLCRERITDIKSVRVVGTATPPTDAPASDVTKPLSKREAFFKFIESHRDAKILMFSSYDATFGAVEHELTTRGITHATVNGSQARIAKLLRDFADGKYNVLFLNARNMGAGLNIIAATHVVLYHKMSAELTNQIVGRANRIGRSEDLHVVHMLHENEVSHTISHV